MRRLWIYETSPASSIKYVATISAGKRPGEIRDPSGLRNDEFDSGQLEHRVKYAYEIRRLETLPPPISLRDLKQNGWLHGPPQKYCYVKQSLRQALDIAQTSLVFDSTTTPLADTANSSDGQPDARGPSSPQGKSTSSARTSQPTPVCALMVEQEPSHRPLQAPTRRSTRTFAGVKKKREGMSPTINSVRQESLHSWLEKPSAT